MPELPNADETTELFTKLDELRTTLTSAQATLLDAILKVAGDVTDHSTLPDELEFSDEFSTAFTPFTPEQAELVIGYATAGDISSRMIVRGGHLPVGTASPAMIVRGGTGGVVTPPPAPTPPPAHS
jgi:hypothetical protein